MATESVEPIVDHIDHFVLTVSSVEATCDFYTRCLGMARVETPGVATGLRFGSQKISVHQIDHTFEPKAAVPTPGSGDFCLITATPLDEVIDRVQSCGISIELGPVERTGASGPMVSVYFRDPDNNLVEVSNYNTSVPTS